MNQLIITGPPGSGKGTLAKQIAEKYKLKHIAAGDLLRSKTLIKDEMGKLISSLINNGNFVPDDLIKQIIEEEVKQYPNFILDGFPRTIKQLYMTNKIIEDFEFKPIVIILQVGMNTALERIRSRSLKEERADDKSNEILKVRMIEFIKKTQPVINHYSNLSTSIVLDANKSKEEVFDEFISKFQKEE